MPLRLVQPAVRLPRRVVSSRWAHSVASQLTSPTIDDVAHFARFLPQNAILTTLKDGASKESSGTDELEQYNTDWMGKYRGQSRLVLRPKSTEDVSKIMKHCWERRIGVVPQGGNTGLVGASYLSLILLELTQARRRCPYKGRSCAKSQLNEYHSLL